MDSGQGVVFQLGCSTLQNARKGLKLEWVLLHNLHIGT